MSAPPAWLEGVISALHGDLPDWFRQFAPPPGVERESAVLMLFGERPGSDGDEPTIEVVLTERGSALSSHAGQVSFPGGRLDPGEDAPTAALREAQEEVGLDPGTVEVIGVLPPLYLSPSRNSVYPVIAWWHEPHDLHIASPFEVASIERVAVADIVDPASRFTVRVGDEYEGYGFDVHGLFVWGFTAHLLAIFLDAAGQTVPWDEEHVRSLPWKYLKPFVERRRAES